MNKEIEQFLIRTKKIEDLNKNNINPFLNKFIEKNQIGDILKKYQNCDYSELDLKKVFVSVSGRIILKRIQGKAGFLILQDFEDTIQIYANNKLVSEKEFWIFKNVDLGDIIAISGSLFKTKTNELTIKSKHVFHLSKSLRPLPDKHKGLKDKETIRKKRFLDLIINEKTRKIFLKRIKIIQNIRNFFNNRGFLEVETPILNSFCGGAAAKPFFTHHNSLESDFYLRIATEIPLKKLIVGGMKAIFEIGRIFRNEGIDAHHNPEFTTIEAYLAYSDMQKMMHLTKDLLREVCQNILGSLTFEYQQHQISFDKFYQYDMVDIIKQKTGVNFYEITSLEDFFYIAREHHIAIEPFYTKGHIIMSFFEKFVEENLVQPTFIYNYPLEVSPLAQINPQNPEFVERFELFIAGKEFVNAFSELNDPIEQKKRFENQLLQKKLGNKEAEELDFDFIEALEYGMPPTGGMGLGIDRLVMLLTNTANIRDVILFPHFKQNKKIL